jgi:antitoxin (DNA-binding transcriptional repressor) of toxin-antitoxin stability system
MKTATVADLRNHFRRISSWIENGETVEIVKCGRVFAHLVPAAQATEKPAKVNWAVQARQIWQGRAFKSAEVKAMEQFEHEGEGG